MLPNSVTTLSARLHSIHGGRAVAKPLTPGDNLEIPSARRYRDQSSQPRWIGHKAVLVRQAGRDRCENSHSAPSYRRGVAVDAVAKDWRLDLYGEHDRGGGSAFRKACRRMGICRAVDPRKPRAERARALVLAPGEHMAADRRDRHRQYLCPRSYGDGEWPARFKRTIGRPLPAGCRSVAPADGPRHPRPHLRQAGGDDASLSQSDARGAVPGADAARDSP